MHDSWIKNSCSGLSEHEIKQKLDQINATVQTDVILKLIRDANEDVSSQVGKIAEVEQALESKLSQHSQLTAKLQQDIATKNSHVEQVHEIRIRTTTQARQTYI